MFLTLHKDKAEEYRQMLLEALAETDEEIMEKYLEGDAISPSELNAAIRRATINLSINPCTFAVHFYKTKGYNLC